MAYNDKVDNGEWELRNLLSETIPKEELDAIYSSYDIVGNIVIIRLTEASKKYCKIVAEAIMGVHKNIEAVWAQTSPIGGSFRLRRLEHIMGKESAVTVYGESKCLFSVDLKECYFSPRLSYERMRIAKQVKDGEVVVNMFDGVGCFSIIIAKYSNAEKIYSIDINLKAIQYLKENVGLNRVYGRVIPMLGDAKETIEKKLCCIADRVLMPLPEKAPEYLPYALLALKITGGWVHYYDFEHAKKGENPIEKVAFKVTKKLESLDAKSHIPSGRIVRTTGPNWHQIVLDIRAKDD